MASFSVWKPQRCLLTQRALSLSADMCTEQRACTTRTTSLNHIIAQCLTSQHSMAPKSRDEKGAEDPATHTRCIVKLAVAFSVTPTDLKGPSSQLSRPKQPGSHVKGARGRGRNFKPTLKPPTQPGKANPKEEEGEDAPAANPKASLTAFSGRQTKQRAGKKKKKKEERQVPKKELGVPVLCRNPSRRSSVRPLEIGKCCQRKKRNQGIEGRGSTTFTCFCVIYVLIGRLRGSALKRYAQEPTARVHEDGGWNPTLLPGYSGTHRRARRSDFDVSRRTEHQELTESSSKGWRSEGDAFLQQRYTGRAERADEERGSCWAQLTKAILNGSKVLNISDSQNRSGKAVNWVSMKQIQSSFAHERQGLPRRLDEGRLRVRMGVLKSSEQTGYEGQSHDVWSYHADGAPGFELEVLSSAILQLKLKRGRKQLRDEARNSGTHLLKLKAGREILKQSSQGILTSHLTCLLAPSGIVPEGFTPKATLRLHEEGFPPPTSGKAGGPLLPEEIDN
ncbi:hypothetical protein BKA70DRAFT_1483539 [Coprinopsis sp. MPI-PUGE-AT-0042]|nr:hypothetical protein BKA70DRAFT_1483539 [Coprinopsis sp. MPI-PUGE-AT-0042]